MMPDKIRELAKSDGLLSGNQLNLKLLKFKSEGWRILECTVYVKNNQNCTLQEANYIVLNSSAWIEDKDDFIKHQEEQMGEFLEAATDDVESIKHIYYPDRTEVQYNMKDKKE